MIFIETPVFTRQVKESLSDDDYRLLQLLLAVRPDAGDLIKGGGGIRKVRWALPGRGKSGGARVIYYWQTTEAHVYMLYLFPKSERSDLAPEQVKQLAKYAKELK
ncbi:MAG: type II toxin-antitoxin system RelE/ParE family toxin [Gammaproteobacteria bacterium]